MLTRFLALPVAFAAAVAILAAPWRTAPASAQTDGMDHGGQMEQSDPLMAQLDQLAGDEFDKAFLVQMSLHHAMAIQMARPAAANAPHQEVRDLSNAIINDQAAEMQKMSGWLQTWYGIDLPMMISMMAGSNTVPMPMDGHHPVGDLMNMGMSILWELPGPRLETVFFERDDSSSSGSG